MNKPSTPGTEDASHHRRVFSDHVTFTMLSAPDDYPADLNTDLEQDFAQLLHEFSDFCGTLSRDLTQADQIRKLLEIALEGYRHGEPMRGAQALKQIRDLKPASLR